MIQFGMRVHDICPKGSVCEVLDEVQKLHIHYIHLAMNKSFSDVDTSVGHFSAGLGDYVASELRSGTSMSPSSAAISIRPIRMRRSGFSRYSASSSI